MVAATNISPLLQECFFSGNICFAQRKLFTFSRISLAVRERSATKQNKFVNLSKQMDDNVSPCLKEQLPEDL